MKSGDFCCMVFGQTLDLDIMVFGQTLDLDIMVFGQTLDLAMVPQTTMDRHFPRLPFLQVLC